MEFLDQIAWMALALGLSIMSASMGVWGQVGQVAAYSMASKEAWRSYAAALALGSAAFGLASLGAQLDAGFAPWPWPNVLGGPFAFAGVLSAVSGVLVLSPIWGDAMSLVFPMAKSRARVWHGLCAASLLALMFIASSPWHFTQACVGISLTSAGAMMACMAIRAEGRLIYIQIASAVVAMVGAAFLVTGVLGLNADAAMAAASALGSLAVIAALHIRIEQVSSGRIDSSVGSGMLSWWISFAVLLLTGPLLWRGRGGSLTDGSHDYMMMLGLLGAGGVIARHFKSLNVKVVLYVEQIGRDRVASLLLGVDAAAMLVGEDGLVIEYSKGALDLLGRPAHHIVGGDVWTLLEVGILGPGRHERSDRSGRDLIVTMEPLGEDHAGLSVVTVRDVTGEKASQYALAKAAREDELTGLPNRREALAIVDQAIEASRGVEGLGVLFLDLDHFKNVNDTEGHAAGDALLREVATVLEESLKERGGWLARLGGDEFLGVIGGADDAAAEAAAHACIDSMELSARAVKGSVGVSVGVAMFPRDGDNAMHLIRRADAAMYEAKSGGRGRVSFFGEDIEQRLMRRVMVEGFLREALKLGRGLTLALQPLCAMDGTYTGQAEALVRAPGMTGLNAQELVEVAESSGLIIPLGRWILRQASAIQLSANKKGAKLCMSINVSAKQFNDDMFWEQFRGQALLGMFPEGVTLEVTETTLMEDSVRSARLLREARDLGAKVALDDFGCGYSSLSTLKRMPLDKLKLDKSLIDEVPDSNESTRVAQAAIVMAQALGLEVVAEGIEREAQARWLASKGVRFGQGFLYAKAMDPELLIELSANGVLPVFLANQ